jgi:endonuclease YncB( thermonuclease family)
VTRFRRRAVYWPIALLILAIGICGRTRNLSSPTAKATNSAAPKPAPIGSMPHKEQQLRPRPSEGGNAVHRDSKQLQIKVVGVHDGDTLTGLNAENVQYKIRLDAVDAPELGQPFGQASKKALSEKVFGKDVVVIRKTTDKYGRTVGHVLLAKRDVNLEMLEEGMAWHYEKYDHNKRLGEAQEQARMAKRAYGRIESPCRRGNGVSRDEPSRGGSERWCVSASGSRRSGNVSRPGPA